VNTEAADAFYAGDEVRLLFLGQSVEFTTSYLCVWRQSDYLSKVDAALAEIPVTPRNHKLRFFVLRMASRACEAAGEFDRAEHYVQQMYALAAGTADEALKSELQAKALGHEIRLARRRQDEAAFTAGVAELTALLNMPKIKETRWVRGERHNLACQLVGDHLYEPALPLWEANAASGGQIGGWGWLMYAATVWQMTHDWEQTLMLLREARAHNDQDMTFKFTECHEFADVREAPDFLQAIRKK